MLALSGRNNSLFAILVENNKFKLSLRLSSAEELKIAKTMYFEYFMQNMNKLVQQFCKCFLKFVLVHNYLEVLKIC